MPKGPKDQRPLTKRQYDALVYLKANGETIIQDIATAIGDDARAARSVLQVLVSRKLVSRRRLTGLVYRPDGAARTGRYTAYRATAAGKAWTGQVVPNPLGRGDAMGRGTPKKPSRAGAAVETALLRFIDVMDVAGGVTRGLYDEWIPPWSDPAARELGEVYVEACRALNRRPKVQ